MLTRSHEASRLGIDPWIRDESPRHTAPLFTGVGQRAEEKANRSDRQKDAKRHILSPLPVLLKRSAGQAVFSADGFSLNCFRCLSRREKVGSKPCFRFAQTSCPAGLKTGSRDSQ